MALIPWLVLLGRSLMFKTLHSMSIVNSPTKKGCTDLLQRIGVVIRVSYFGSAELEKITENF